MRWPYLEKPAEVGELEDHPVAEADESIGDEGCRKNGQS